MFPHRSAFATSVLRFRRNASYTEEELQNRELYEAYRAGHVVIFPHLDCVVRYINELEKFYAEHEGGSVVSEVAVDNKLQELHGKTPINRFTVFAPNGYTIPGVSDTHSTILSAADPSIAWNRERPRFSDAVEVWTLGLGNLKDHEISGMIKTVMDQLAATEWLEILVRKRKSWKLLRSKRPRAVEGLAPSPRFSIE